MMDTLTREAIDERLRVLDGVSGAVYRCIDDLMRIRSILPAKSPSGTAAPPSIVPVRSNVSAQAPTDVSSDQSPESSSEGSKSKDPDEKSTLDAANTSQLPSNDVRVSSQSSST
jgi:E3 ubiquitin-protein ligase synoviolin